MSPENLLSELSVKIYEPPLNALRQSGAIADLSDPVNVAMLIVDFETEVSMNGINNFLGNSTGRYALQTVSALQEIGCPTQAALLQQIINIAVSAGMTHEAIQQERGDLEPYSVTTFSELHGNKWDMASEQIAEVEAGIDYSQIVTSTEVFICRHTERFHKVLGCF